MKDLQTLTNELYEKMNLTEDEFSEMIDLLDEFRAKVNEIFLRKPCSYQNIDAFYKFFETVLKCEIEMNVQFWNEEKKHLECTECKENKNVS